MARSYRQYLGRQTGHNAQTIVSCIIVLFAVLFCRADADAAFSVITSKKTEQTACYWIEADTLELCSGDRLPFSDVISIDSDTATAEELSVQKQASLQCIEEMEKILEREEPILSKEEEVAVQLNLLTLHIPQPDKKSLSRKKKQIKKLLKELLRSAKKTQNQWRAVRIPDYHLLQLRDIKVIQYSIRMQAYSEWMLYLKNGDVTRRAYAIEHDRRTGMLENKFLLKLENAKLFIAQGGLDSPFIREHSRPNEAGVSTIPPQ